MKNILFLLLLIPVISFSQYSKKELKKLKKMELKIVNRGLDLDATFVPYYRVRESGDGWNTETGWGEAMFTLGLDVGDYSSSKTALTFNGRYIFDSNTYGVIKIQDLEDNNKIVATIKYKGALNWHVLGKDISYRMEYVIRELIKSNK